MSSHRFSEPCDSFFAEDVQDSRSSTGITHPEDDLQTLSHEDRQLIIAENLSTEVAYEYGNDVVLHMIRMELETIPDVGAIDLQPEIEYFMRGYLLDFLIEAHGAFKLLPETLFLAVNLLDRYCSKRIVYSRHYQLVGCASLLLAAKYGDKKDRVPLKELEVMCQSTYTADMIRQMEWHVLQTLEWQIGHSTIDHFIQIQLVNVEYDEELEHMTLFLSELALYCRDFISVRSSVMATAALTLARYILDREHPVMDEKPAELDAIISRLCSYLHSGTHVLVKKYSHTSLSNVSDTVRQYLQRQITAYAESQAYMANAPTFEEYSESVSTRELPSSMHDPQTPPRRTSPDTLPVPKDYITPPITPEEAVFGDNYMVAQEYRDCDMMDTPTRQSTTFVQTGPVQQLEWVHYDPDTY